LNFKIDENLPAECAALLRGAGFGADTVAAERRLPFEVQAPNATTR
jgi:antitoxin component of RelBE/YafQ-DinJ toxin-antitoxin module